MARNRFNDMTDHDIIIENTVKIENISEKIDIFLHSIEDRVNKKVDDSYFRWFIGIIVVVLLSLSGTVWQSNNSIADVKNKINLHEQKQIFLKK